MSQTYSNLVLESLYSKSLRIDDGGTDADNPLPGQMRFNSTTKKFEGYTGAAGPLGETWRELTSEMAAANTLGGIKVGSNLTINTDTGVMASIASGESRFHQQIITVSKNSGKADYLTIFESNGAIPHAIGSSPYTGGAATSLYGAPSATNQYIIVVGPGTYNEKITLPDYVSIKGEHRTGCIIKPTSGASSLASSPAIICGSGAYIGNLTIEHQSGGSAYASGIYMTSEDNVLIDNVEIKIAGTDSTTASYGIYNSAGTNVVIQDCIINTSQGTGTNYGIYNTGSSPTIVDTKVTMTPGATVNYGIYNNSSSDAVMVNNNITINGATTNVGIYNNESSPQLQEINVNVNGGSNTGYGIQNASTNKSATITGTTVSFTNTGSGTRDTITDSGAGFLSAGFAANQVIKVSGASNANNNKTYSIFSVTATVITLNYNQDVTTESAGNSVTIDQLYTQIIDNCVIEGSTKSIYNSNSNGHYALRTATSKLLGGPVQSNSGIISFQHLETIIVAKEGGDFYTLSEALTSITDNTVYKRYLIKIKPGTYSEASAVTLKQYVDVEGSGKDSTIISLDITNASLGSSAAAIIAASNSTISHLTIKNASTSTNYSIGLYTDSPSALVLDTVGITMSGTSQNMYGGYVDATSGGSLTIKNCVISVTSGGSGTTNQGLKIGTASGETSAEIRGTEITVSGASSGGGNYGIDLTRGTVNIEGSKITISGNTTTNRGINTNTYGSTSYLTQVFNTNINTSGTSNHSANVSTYYSVVFAGCRLTGSRTFNTSDSSSVLKCVGCYEMTSGLAYKPIGSEGTNDTDSGNVSLGDGAGNAGSSGTGNTSLGDSAGSALGSGSNNTFVGREAGNANTIGSDNTFVGQYSGTNTIGGDYNTFLGSMSGNDNTSGDSNTFIGYSAGYNHLSGDRNVYVGEKSGYNSNNATLNVFIGYNSGYSTTSGQQNVFVGGGNTSNGSGYSNTTGIGNTYLGYQAGKTSISSNDNTILGRNAGYLTTSSQNTFIGSSAGYNNAGGSKNVFVGKDAGYSNTTGEYNTFIGTQAGRTTLGGAYNVFMGTKTGYSNTSGSRNIFVGSATSTTNTDAAGYANTIGSDNIFIGSQSGKSNISGTDNIIQGTESGKSITTGSKNIMLGSSAGANMVTASQNIIIGHLSGKNARGNDNIMIGTNAGLNASGSKNLLIGSEAGRTSEGNDNVYIGYQAGKNIAGDNATGSGNVMIGQYIGKNIQGGSKNVLLGSGTSSISTGKELVSGSDNIMVGYQAGITTVNTNNNIFIGSHSGYSTTVGESNLFMGTTAGYTNTKGTFNSFLGRKSGYSNTTGNDNTFVGYQSGYSNTSGEQNFNLGTDAGYSNTVGDGNMMMGFKSGYYNTSNYNLCLGYQSGYKNTLGSSNIFLGYKSGSAIGSVGDNQIGSYNVNIGTEAGYSNTEGNRNIFLGYRSGMANTTGGRNVFIGESSGRNNTTGIANIFIGMGAGGNDDGVGFKNTSGDYNAFIGYLAGSNNTEGEHNIFFGSEAGLDNTTGNKNIAIGYRAGRDATSNDNNISIGTLAGRNNKTGTANIYMGYEAGTETAINRNNNILIGQRAGYYNKSNDNIFIGAFAGRLNTNGNDNIFIGPEAGYSNEVGSDNIFLGPKAGNKNIGDDNIYIGSSSGYSGTSGDNNIMVGSEAGYMNTTGLNNIGVGVGAGRSNVGNDNIFIGHQSGYNSLDVNKNIFIGSGSGYNNKEGESNILIGSDAGYNSNVDSNLMIGFKAGYSTTNGGSNIFIGNQAGKQNVTGGENIMMGYLAGSAGGTDTLGNIFIGKEAGKATTTDNNIYIGKQSGKANTSGNDNIFIGVDSGLANLIGSDNVFIGPRTGKANLGNDNIFIGSYAGTANTSGKDNIFIGTNSGLANLIGKNNICVGPQTGKASLANDNIFIGSSAGTATTSGTKNIFVGTNSGLANLTGENNIFVGPQTGKASLANDNIFIGSNAGTATTSGTKNIFVGINSGLANLTGENNIFVGPDTGKANLANDNIFVGRNAGTATTSGTKNIFVGTNSGLTNLTGDNNIFVGPETGKANLANDNIFIGSTAGYSNKVGTNCILMGTNAGYYSNADSNIFVGPNSGYNTRRGQSNLFFGSSSGYTNRTGDNNICIGTNSGYNANVDNNLFIGYRSGYNTTLGDGNIYIGSNSGQANTLGKFNIGIGFESLRDFNNVMVSGNGYNVALGYQAGRKIGNNTANKVSTAYNNVILGYRAGSNGDMNQNNILVGTQTGEEVDNTRLFSGNAILGTKAARYADHLVNSCVFGPSAIGAGKGGYGNLVFGHTTGYNMGVNKEATTTLKVAAFTGNYDIMVDMPFGTASYYFRSGDTIMLDSNYGSNYEELTVSSIRKASSVAGSKGNDTIITLEGTFSANHYPAGSSVYRISKLDTTAIGDGDKTQSAGNIIMGTESGKEITLGGKNIALGDRTLITNTIGKYNTCLGAETGSSAITDNNTFIGTKAGYSIDSYSTASDIMTGNDLVFDANTASITSFVSNMATFEFGHVIDITGSSSNDGRYRVKSGAANTVQLEGFPYYKQDGIPDTVDNDYSSVATASQINFVSQTVTSNKIKFNRLKIGTAATESTITTNDNSIDLSVFKYASHIIVSGSNDNDGVYTRTLAASQPISSSSIQVKETNITSEECFLGGKTVTLTARCITYDAADTTDKKKNMTSFRPLQTVKSYFGKNRGVYTIDPEQGSTYYGIGIKEDIQHSIGGTNLIFTESATDSGTNLGITNQSEITYYSNQVTFNSNNTIYLYGYSNPSSAFGANSFIKINGSSNNDGYLLLSSIAIFDAVHKKMTIDSSTPVNNETINGGTNIIISSHNGLSGNKIASNFNKNEIVDVSQDIDISGLNNVKFQNEGSFIIGASNASIVAFTSPCNYKDGNPTNTSMAKGKYTVSNTNAANDAISGMDIHYVNKTITGTNISFIQSGGYSYIKTTTKYGFSDFIPPCIVLVDGALNSDNNKFFKIDKNEPPFTLMRVDNHYSSHITTETAGNSITIKANSIGSYLKQTDFSSLYPGQKVRLFGDYRNHEKEIIIEPRASVDKYCIYSNTDLIQSIGTNSSNKYFNERYRELCLVKDQSGDFHNTTISGTDISFDGTSTPKTIDSVSTDLSGFYDGSIIKVSGSGTSGNNRYYYVQSATSTTITLDSNGGSPATVSAGDTINIRTNTFNTTDGFNLKYLSNMGSLNFNQTNITTDKHNRLLGKNCTIATDSNSGKPLVRRHSIYFNEALPNDNNGTQMFNINLGYHSNGYCNVISQTTVPSKVSFTLATNTISFAGCDFTRSSSGGFINNPGRPILENTLSSGDFRVFRPGQIIYTNGASNASNNNKYYLIKSISNDYHSIVVDNSYYGAGASFSMADESNTATVTFTCDAIESISKSNFEVFNYPYDAPESTFASPRNDYFSNDLHLYEYFKTKQQMDLAQSEVKTSLFSTSALKIASGVKATKNCIYLKNTSDSSLTSENHNNSVKRNNLIINSNDLTLTNGTDIFFRNNSVTGTDIAFTGSTITSSSTDLSVFSSNALIKVSGTTNNNGYVQVSTTTPTSNLLTLTAAVTSESAGGSFTVASNTINSTTTDLSIFKPGQVAIIESSILNNGGYPIVTGTGTTARSIYVEGSILNENPMYARIEKSPIINESNVVVGSSNISFDGSGNITSTSGDLSIFRPGQTLEISNTTNNNNNDFTVATSDSKTITSSETTVSESNTSAQLKKKVTFTRIGQPITVVTSSNTAWTGGSGSIAYHYFDAQGNNLMVGGYAGQYVGAKNNAIHNTIIGNRCGQVNHGSGNIFIGSETVLATSATSDVETTYSNKFAIYKTNFYGVPSEPLVGGDFSTGTVGINTIDPDTYISTTNITETDNKLIINGSCKAYAFSPFTGLHIVKLSSRVIESDLVAGMIVVSTGNVTVNNVIDTKVEVELSSSVNNKTVYGVYAHSEKVNDKMNEQHILKMVDFVKWLGRDSDSNVGNDGYVKYQIGQIPNGVSVPSNATYYQDTIVIENPNYNSNHFVTVHYSASVGEGTILVTNIGGEIENGDYITSSAITGYGQKQSDDILRSYTVAKCTQTIDWDSVNDTIEYNGTSYKKVLIACTYHCG